MRPVIIEKEKIITATIDYAAAHGLEHVSAMKIARSIGISDATIFNDFGTMSALFTECLYYIDRAIDRSLAATRLSSPDMTSVTHELWRCYFDYLVKNSGEAKFYRQLRHSSYYTEGVIAGEFSAYPFFSRFIENNTHVIDAGRNTVWSFIIENTLNFAIRVADGQFSGDEASIISYRSLVFFGLSGVDWIAGNSFVLGQPANTSK